MIINKILFSVLILLFSRIIGCKYVQYDDDEEDNETNVYYQTEFLMEQVKKLELIECENEEDNSCPAYSLGCQYYLNTNKFQQKILHDYYCKFNFICKSSGQCLFFNNDNTYKIKEYGEYGFLFKNKNNMNESLILHSCNKVSYENNKCETVSCENNSDCYSGLCVSGTCLTNPSNPSYICSLRDDSNPELISCRYNNQESCSDDNDCHSNICLDGICVDTNEKNKSRKINTKKFNYDDDEDDDYEEHKGRNYTELTISILLAIFSFVIIVLIIITIFCMFCRVTAIRPPPRPSKRRLKTSESETIYIINENNELIKTKLKMLDSCHSNYSYSSNKHRDKKRVLTKI